MLFYSVEKVFAIKWGEFLGLGTHAALLRPLPAGRDSSSVFATPSAEDVRVEDATVIFDVDALAQFQSGELLSKTKIVPCTQC